MLTLPLVWKIGFTPGICLSLFFHSENIAKIFGLLASSILSWVVYADEVKMASRKRVNGIFNIRK